MKLLGVFFCILLTFAKCDDTVTRMMYDSMSMLVGEDTYPESLWIERQECFNKISPGLIDTLDLAWQVKQLCPELFFIKGPDKRVVF